MMGHTMSSYEVSNSLFKKIKTTEPFALTTIQCRLISKSWVLARKQGLDEPGRSILLEIFKLDPEIETKFGTKRILVEGFGSKERKLTAASAIPTKPEFYLHSQSFTLLLEMIVKVGLH